MQLNQSRRSKFVQCALILFFAVVSFAQTPSTERRITGVVNDQNLITRTGNVHPLARRQYDRGAAPDSLPASRMLLVLQRGPEQQAALEQFLDDQHTQSSPNYHKWLTPAEFGQTFGPSDADIATVTNWLISHGFQVNSVGAGRTAIEFSGNAGQVRDAFHTEIHKFVVNGENHWANTSDPQIPAALGPVVSGIVSLHNFRAKPLSHTVATAEASPNAVSPGYTFTCNDHLPCYGIGPADFATIYNVQPLWGAGTDGTGQAIAIVGRTNIDIQDVRDFRNLFGLPTNDPQIVLNGPDPGIVSTDEQTEADLDVQWSGAVAKGATIKFVVSGSTDVADGIDLSTFYIVDNNLAPVMSMSFGNCESSVGTSYSQFIGRIWEQAAAQGITAFVSAGDNGAAGCDDQNLVTVASDGVGVNALASSPFNVAVGGTDFDQNAGNFSTYWNSTNASITHLSARSYIPETTWNESCVQGAAGCTTGGIWAGSGGPSSVWNQKPSWQTGTGVPQDGHRDLPDVSLFASTTGGNRSAYVVCQKSSSNSCANGYFYLVGGTSAGAPSFAGIMALVNHYQVSHGSTGRQGNANYKFYALAARNGASCNSSTAGTGANSCIFYDTTKGNISVPCATGSPNCGPSGLIVDPANPTTPAWTATAGYDMATGLGSVNAQNLVTNWGAVSFAPTTTTITSLSPRTFTHGGSTNLTVTVAATSGSGTPTGDVSVIGTYPDGSSRVLVGDTLTSGSSSGNVSTFAGGTYNVTAHYAGDGTFAASDSAPVQVTVNPETSKTLPGLVTYDNTGARITANASTAAYGSPYILEINVTNSSGSLASLCYNLDVSMCPTGTITLTDNGSPLDGGSFALNTLGFADDEAIQLSGGSHSIVASYSGDKSFQASSASTTIAITKAITAIATPSADNASVATGTTVNIVTTVTTASNGAAPTGTVTFYNGNTPLSGAVTYTGAPATATVAASLTATLATSFSAPGAKTITAVYNGDINYAASPTSAATTIQVTGTALPDFSLPATSPSVTISGAGQSGTSAITITSIGGYTGPVTMSCTVNSSVSKAPGCSISSSVPLAANSTTNSTLTITTTPATVRTAGLSKGVGWLSGGIFACVLFGIPGLKRRSRPMVLLLVIGLVLLGGTVACGGGGGTGGGGNGGSTTDPGTPAGTYSVSVTATAQISGVATSRTTNVSVTVQ